MKGFFQILAGTALIALGVAAPGVGSFAIAAGAGMVLSGIGTLITGNHPTGSPSATSDPLRPWNVVVGQARVAGDLIYRHAWGTNNVMVDLVYVLACHSIQSVDALLFDGQRVPLDFSKCPSVAGGGWGHNSPTIGATSFKPAQQDEPLTGGGIIARHNDVVTVTCPFNIPYLIAGDRINLYDVPGDLTLNGTFIVDQILSQTAYPSPGSIVFTFLSGGPDSGLGILNAGHVKTLWPSYGQNVYFEALLGDQVQGETFNGMVVNFPGGVYNPSGGTPWNGTGTMISPEVPSFSTSGPLGLLLLSGLTGGILYGIYNLLSSGGPGYDADSNNQGKHNPWTADCSCVNKAVVFLRVEYSKTLFMNNTLPSISFLVHGKNDIYDPRLGAPLSVGMAAVSVAAGGFSYQMGECLQVDGGSGGFVLVTGIGSGGAVTSVSLQEPGRNYTVSTQGTFGGQNGQGCEISITAVVGGVDSTIGYSDNAALVIADYLAQQPVGTVDTASGMSWGYGAEFATPSLSEPPYNSINTPALIAAANVCDTAIPINFPVGGTEPMYCCDGQFDLSMKRGEILSNLLTSCAGRLTYVGGQYYIYPGAWNPPASPPGGPIDLMPMLAGPIRWKPTVSIRDLYNGVKGSFISPANHWQSADIPYYAQDANHGYDGPSQYGGDINVPLDNGERLWFDIHLPFTISPSAAQRIEKIELMRRRQQGTGTFVLNMAGWQFAPMDVIQATLPFLSWTGKYLEIAAVRFKLDKLTMSIEIDVQETDSSVYDWSLLEQLSPQGYVEAYLPAPSVLETVPFPWSPGYVAPYDGDAYYPAGHLGPGNFGMQTAYAANAQGNAVATDLQIKGTPPINALDTQLGSPYVIATASATGGTLLGGTYVIGITAFSSGASNAQDIYYRDLATVIVPGGTTGSIGLIVEWSSGDTGGDVYMALRSLTSLQYARLIGAGQKIAMNVFHWQQTLTPGQATGTITAFDQSTPGGPDTVFNKFGVAWNKEIHSGPWAQQVQAVTATTVTIAGPGMTTNQWAGYVLSLMAPYDPSLEVKILNMPVLSSTASASVGGVQEFILTIGPNSASVQLPNLTTLLEVGDLVSIRSNFTFTADSMTDPNIANGYYPGGATGVEKGHLAMVMTGADAGDVQTISSVTGTPATTFNISGTFQVTPAAGDLVIIVAPETAPEVPTAAISSTNKTLPGPGIVATPSIANLLDQAWLVTVYTETATGNRALDFTAPRREVYFFGAQGTRLITANATQLTWDSLIDAICSTADITYQLVPFSATPNQAFTCEKLDATSWGVIVQCATGDTFADGTTSRTIVSKGDSFSWRSSAG